MIHALLFEVNAIQQYLFGSGRLRDVIGASELIDLLTNQGAKQGQDPSLLNAVKTRIHGGKSIEFSRRAGGAFYAFSEDGQILERFMALWTLAVQQWAPDISYNVGLAEGSNHLDAFDNARKRLRRDNSRLRPRLPVAAPPTERNRRTGLAAESKHPKDGLIDAATNHKKIFADLSRAGFIQRFSPPEANLSWRDWPRDMEPAEDDHGGAFPFVGDDRTVALVHADGNGLGQVLLNINSAVQKQPDMFMQLYQSVSRMVEESAIQAAHEATRKVLLPAREDGKPLPARPVLLGGEDAIVIVRADLTLEYIETFAEVFEKESRRHLENIAKSVVGSVGADLPTQLTMGFGVVFLRASQPFHLGIRLAEELMSLGKRQAKALAPTDPPASLAFHRVTATLVDDYETILARELSHRHDDVRFVETLGTYFLDKAEAVAPQPRLADLRALAALLGGGDVAHGPIRQLLGLMGLAPAEARARYRRWRQVMKDREKSTLDNFDYLMKILLGSPAENDLPYGATEDGGIRRSPLGDALALLGACSPTQGATLTDEEYTA